MADNEVQDMSPDEAQANLLRIREGMGIQNTLPRPDNIRSILSSRSNGRGEGDVLSMEEIFSRRCAGPVMCDMHEGNELPCPLCEADRAEHQRVFEEMAEAKARHLRENPEPLLEAIGIGKRHRSSSLENFAGGHAIKTVCRECADDPFDLVLSGLPGCGKTHLACGIVRELVRSGKYGPASARFITASELLMEIRRTYRGSSDDDESDMVERFGSIGLLVLDDVGAEKATDWAIATLYLIIDRRYREMRPTIVTTNLSVDEIAGALSPRIASRLSAGKVVEIKMPDWRKRRG